MLTKVLKQTNNSKTKRKKKGIQNKKIHVNFILQWMFGLLVSQSALCHHAIQDVISVNDNDRSVRCNLGFVTISSLHCVLSQIRMFKWPGCIHVHIMCNTSGAHLVQRVVCHF